MVQCLIDGSAAEYCWKVCDGSAGIEKPPLRIRFLADTTMVPPPEVAALAYAGRARRPAAANANTRMGTQLSFLTVPLSP
jgi:septum formation inhibitor-activating ATPase MinD